MQRNYGGQTAATRRARRRTQLIDAAIDAMAGGEWRLVTVEKLCAAAGLNKRYFYESFTDLDAAAAAAIDDIAEEVRTATLATLAASTDLPVEQQTHATANAVVQLLIADPRRARVLLGGVTTSSPTQHQHRARAMRGLTAVLVGHARTGHDVELASDPLAQLTPAFIIGGTADAILAFIDGRAAVTADELVTTLATLWLLTGNGAAEIAAQRAGQRAGSAARRP